MSNHCWHKTMLAGSGIVKSYDGEICCFCGDVWSEHHKEVPTGHGEFCPKEAKSRPLGPCVARTYADKREVKNG